MSDATYAYRGKPIGVQNVTWFPLQTDVAGTGATYGTPLKISRAMKVSLSPQLASALLESDDSPEDDINLLSGYTVSIDASQLNSAARVALFGNTIDDNNGVLGTSTDTPGLGALAFKALLSKQSGDDKYRYVVLYKGSFKPISENFETKKKEGLTFQTHEGLEGAFSPRDADGRIIYSMDEYDEGVDATAISNWFSAPAEASFTTSTPPGDG